LFKDFVIFVRDSQISTQIDLPANYCSDKASEIVHTMQIGAKDARPGLASFALLFEEIGISHT
jgi:hypothetical protein